MSSESQTTDCMTDGAMMKPILKIDSDMKMSGIFSGSKIFFDAFRDSLFRHNSDFMFKDEEINYENYIRDPVPQIIPKANPYSDIDMERDLIDKSFDINLPSHVKYSSVKNSLKNSPLIKDFQDSAFM